MWNCSVFFLCFFFWYDVVWSWQWEVCLVVYSKFLHPYPCDGHHRAFQLDPGLEGDIEEWEGGFHYLRFFDPALVFFFSFLCLCHPGATSQERKGCYFGWVWIFGLPWNKSEQAATKINTFQQKSDLVYVSCWNHLEFMESFVITTQPLVYQACLLFFFFYSTRIFLSFNQFPFWAIESNNTRWVSTGYGWHKAIRCIRGLEPPVASDRKRCRLHEGGCFYGNRSRWRH